MPSFVSNLAAMPARTKAVMAVAAVAIIAITFFMLKLATAPSYSTVMTGVDPAETGKITAALDERGIPYQLRSNGTALAVDASQTAQARVALAEQGLGGTAGGKGFELFDEQKLGASDFQNKVTYQRALEGEITRTLSNVQGVNGAQVQLVMPEDDLFADSATPASAAVMLDGSGDMLEPGAVRGIAQLVSSSVKGLKSDKVTITDSSGQLLWPQGDGGTGGTAGATKQAAEASYERGLEANLNAMLARTLGPGKAQVQVNADLNVDKTTLNKLEYAKRGTPLKETEENERLRGGGGGGAAGAAGTGANIPNYAQGGAGGGNSNYQRESRTTDLGVDKTVSKTEVAPGTVEKLNLALMVDKTVPAATFAQLQKTVQAAAGVDTQRGDAFQAAQLAFAKPVEPKAGPVPMALLGPLKWAGIGHATQLFLFFMIRHLRKRESETLAEPAWLTQIEEPVSLAALESGNRMPADPGLDMLPPRTPDTDLNKLDQLMDREPERVAAQVRQWMSED